MQKYGLETTIWGPYDVKSHRVQNQKFRAWYTMAPYDDLLGTTTKTRKCSQGLLWCHPPREANGSPWQMLLDLARILPVQWVSPGSAFFWLLVCSLAWPFRLLASSLTSDKCFNSWNQLDSCLSLGSDTWICTECQSYFTSHLEVPKTHTPHSCFWTIWHILPCSLKKMLSNQWHLLFFLFLKWELKRLGFFSLHITVQILQQTIEDQSWTSSEISYWFLHGQKTKN